MKSPLPLLASALIALSLPACFQSETTIHLNKDGSGTLVEDTRFGAQMLAMLDQMAGLGGDPAKANPIDPLLSEEKAKACAARLGEGVSYQKSESVEADGARGARVTYQFKDINHLKVATDESMKNLSPMGDMVAAAADKTEPIAFSYAAGKLTIRMPEPPKPAAAAAPDAEKPAMPDMENPEAQAMVKQMLADMKISLKVVIEPGIGETNASHHDANTITLMEMNMGRFVEKPDNLKILGKVDQNNPAAAMETLKGIDGVKFEALREVTVEVK